MSLISNPPRRAVGAFHSWAVRAVLSEWAYKASFSACTAVKYAYEIQRFAVANKTLLQTFILLAIQGEPSGTTIRLPELYKRVKDFLTFGAAPGTPANVIALCNELRKCADRGDLPDEPRWKNDIRWAIRHAVDAGILKHVGTPKSGEWLRI